MIRHGMRPIIILMKNCGYIIEDAIHQGPYNRIKNWDYVGLMEMSGPTARARAWVLNR